MGLNDIAEISKQALLITQAKFAVTGNNIANANTEGYSRKRLDVSPTISDILGGFVLGGALRGDTLQRIRQSFQDYQFWSQNSLKFKYSTEEGLLQQMEGVLAEPSDAGLRNLISEFWNAWSDLANDPNSSVARTVVRDSAELLVITLNRLHRENFELQSNLRDEIRLRVDEINLIAGQIANLNKSNTGGNADLEDQRDRLIDRLSELTNIEVNPTGNSVNIAISGLRIVSGSQSVKLTVDDALNANGSGGVSVNFAGTDHKVNIRGGITGGLIQVVNEDIPDHLDRLNTVAATLVEEVNARHKTGFAKDGSTGIDFFSPSVTNAGNIEVNPLISANLNLLVASGALPDEPGDGTIAQSIANLAVEKVIEGESIGRFYDNLVGTLANRINEVRFLGNGQEKVVSQLDLLRKSVSGVNMEEEMAQMLQLEQAFTAASRVIAATDEMIRTVLDIV